MYPRHAHATLVRLARGFPVLALTGPLSVVYCKNKVLLCIGGQIIQAICFPWR